MDELKNIISVMRKKYRMDISPYDLTYLESLIERRLTALSMDSIKKYLDLISENKKEAKKFFDSLPNSHSKFFRNSLTFSLLEHEILPLIFEEKERSKSKEIRIWSSACAAGQEAYSIAILLDEIAAAKGAKIPFTIFATDLHKAALDLAAKGTYGFEMVENVRLKHIQKYFTVDSNRYTVSPRLKDHIDFSFYDLLETKTFCPPVSIYGEFDIIILNNVLYYYRPKIQQIIINKSLSSLSAGGYLVTGKTEKSIIEATKHFCAVSSPAPVFRKIIKRR